MPGICAAGAVSAVKQKLTLTKVLEPVGDDRLSLKGQGTLPMPIDPPLAPQINGVRLLIHDATGGVVVDATIAGEPYDSVTRTGWKVNGAGTGWTYKNPGNQPQGITIVGLKTVTSLPGLVKFKAKGKNGAYPVDTGNLTALPLKGTLILDPPIGATGQCIEATFSAVPPARPSCVVAGAGTLVKCK